MTSKIDQNKHYASLLGWSPLDFGGFAFDDLLVNLISARQQLWKVGVDGVAGQRTYAAQLMSSVTALELGVATLENSGKIALRFAKSLWLERIIDLPPASSSDYAHSRDAIDVMIRTQAGLNWTWEPLYGGNFEWCGAFAARGWAVAGLNLKARTSFFSSTYRLDRWARYLPFDANTPNPRPTAGPHRMIIDLDENSRTAVFPDGTLPREGDIMMVGPAKSAYGKHITLVESFTPDSQLFRTIEGNGTGLSPDGNRQHGVVRALRPLGLLGSAPTTYHARRIIRPAPSDCGI